MSVGDIIVYAIAFAAIAFLCILALINWKNILKGFAWFTIAAAVVGVGLIALGIVVYVGVSAWERKQMQECLTAHERRAKAYVAPDDYFGRQLRGAAAEEEKKCADLAAKKEAEEKSRK